MDPSPAFPHLVLGGCRSGKSAHAEGLIQSLPPPHIYLASARVLDAEMAQRVQIHRNRRGPQWQTLEAPLDPLPALRELAAAGRPVLFDCLTMWLSNLLLDAGPSAIADQIEALCALLRERRPPMVLVSNEVGAGIVPDNALARAFRDWAGFANQQVAAACPAVTWMVAGLPVPLKPSPHASPAHAF